MSSILIIKMAISTLVCAVLWKSTRTEETDKPLLSALNFTISAAILMLWPTLMYLMNDFTDETATHVIFAYIILPVIMFPIGYLAAKVGGKK